MTVGQVVEQVRGYGCELVELTGGEPLLQEAAYPLIDALLADRKIVMVETSGAIDLARVDQRVIKIMDLKCPGSGESDRNLWSNLDHLTARDEIKFVIGDRADYEWARQAMRERGLDAKVGAILMSCVFGKLEPATLANWIIEDRIPARLQLQLHKYIWSPDARGV